LTPLQTIFLIPLASLAYSFGIASEITPKYNVYSDIWTRKENKKKGVDNLRSQEQKSRKLSCWI